MKLGALVDMFKLNTFPNKSCCAQLEGKGKLHTVKDVCLTVKEASGVRLARIIDCSTFVGATH